MRHTSQRRAGFTLIELMVVIVVAAILVTLGLTSFRAWIIEQRLKSLNGQLVTDLQLARAEATSRNVPVYYSYRAQSGTQTCYTIYTTSTSGAFCNCTLGVGAACPLSTQTEIKTVQMPWDGSVRMRFAELDMAFDNVSGGVVFGTIDFGSIDPLTYVIDLEVIGDTAKKLRTTISPGGRPSVCSAGSKQIVGYAAC